jgi:hypothetical protein
VVKAQGNSMLWDFNSLGCWVLCLLGLFCGFWVYFSFLFFLCSLLLLLLFLFYFFFFFLFFVFCVFSCFFFGVLVYTLYF